MRSPLWMRFRIGPRRSELSGANSTAWLSYQIGRLHARRLVEVWRCMSSPRQMGSWRRRADVPSLAVVLFFAVRVLYRYHRSRLSSEFSDFAGEN